MAEPDHEPPGYKPPGQEQPGPAPAGPARSGQDPVQALMDLPHDVAVVYVPGTPGPIPADPESLRRLLAEHRFFSVDIRGMTFQQATPVLDALGTDAEARNFLFSFDQHPTILEHDDQAWLVLVAAGSEQDLVEIHVVVSEQHLLLAHDGPCPALLRELFQPQLEDSRPEHSKTADLVPGALALHRLTDAVAETFTDVLDVMDDEIDELELRIFQDPSDDNLRRVFEMRRDVVHMRRVLVPQRDLLARLAGRAVAIPSWTDADQNYFQISYEQFIRLTDLLDSYRDLLGGALDVHLSTVSNRMGEVNKQLTLIATIFLPLSFLTGFFGQNFGFMINHLNGPWMFLGLGVGVELVAIAILYWFFRHRGWLRPDMAPPPKPSPTRRRGRSHW